MTIKEFLLLKENRKAYWSAGNWLMALIVSFLTYQASDNIEWALILLPIARILSEMLTRYINNAYKIE